MSKPSIFMYLPKEASVIWKMAEVQKEETKNPLLQGMKAVASNLAWMGAGTLAGYGGGALLGRTVRVVTGKEISPALLQVPASAAGAGLSLAYKKYKDQELEELRRAVESYRNRPTRSVSG